jgi:hypothetical protein
VFVGGEARYLRKYDGVDLGTLVRSSFSGQIFLRLSKSPAISGTWSVQVAGHATEVPGAFDLTNFTHQQATLRVEYNF